MQQSSVHRKYKYISMGRVNKVDGVMWCNGNGFGRILFKLCENPCIALYARKLVRRGNGDRKWVDNVIVMNKMSSHKLFTTMSFVSYYISNVCNRKKIVKVKKNKKKGMSEITSVDIYFDPTKPSLHQTNHNIYILLLFCLSIVTFFCIDFCFNFQ